MRLIKFTIEVSTLFSYCFGDCTWNRTATRDHLPSILNHGVSKVVSFTSHWNIATVGTLLCSISLDLMFWIFVEHSISFVPNGF